LYNDAPSRGAKKEEGQIERSGSGNTISVHTPRLSILYKDAPSHGAKKEEVLIEHTGSGNTYHTGTYTLVEHIV
jgi:hypothetical protein